MAHILAESVTIDYPLTRSISSKAARKNGGSDRLGANMVLKNGKPFLRAIDNLSLEVHESGRLGIIGLNGSGKSTMLRALAGIFPPSSGRIRVEGEISSLLNVGLGTRSESTGRQNIYLRGYMRGMSKQQIREKEEEIIEFSELHEYIDMPVRNYSAGMGLRLSFAIATTLQPEVLLLDEWIGAGDQQFQQKARQRMKDIFQNSGLSVICSHNVRLIESNCDQVIWLHRGKVVREGATFDVLPHYEEWRLAMQHGSEDARIEAPDRYLFDSSQ